MDKNSLSVLSPQWLSAIRGGSIVKLVLGMLSCEFELSSLRGNGLIVVVDFGGEHGQKLRNRFGLIRGILVRLPVRGQIHVAGA